MVKDGSSFQARFKRLNCGLMIAADVEFDGQVARTPNWEQATRFGHSQPGPPDPVLHGSDEALAYLQPQGLDAKQVPHTPASDPQFSVSSGTSIRPSASCWTPIPAGCGWSSCNRLYDGKRCR